MLLCYYGKVTLYCLYLSMCIKTHIVNANEKWLVRCLSITCSKSTFHIKGLVIVIEPFEKVKVVKYE